MKQPVEEDRPKVVTIDYTNHRGERSVRLIYPYGLEFKSTEWHPDEQWILEAYDFEREAPRGFAWTSVHSVCGANKQSTIDTSIAKQLQRSIEKNGRMKLALNELLAKGGTGNRVIDDVIANIARM